MNVARTFPAASSFSGSPRLRGISSKWERSPRWRLLLQGRSELLCGDRQCAPRHHPRLHKRVQDALLRGPRERLSSDPTAGRHELRRRCGFLRRWFVRDIGRLGPRAGSAGAPNPCQSTNHSTAPVGSTSKATPVIRHNTETVPHRLTSPRDITVRPTPKRPNSTDNGATR